MRAPRQVSERLIILGTIAFRASLEVTDDPRVRDFSNRLLPWLVQLGCEDELDPIERELLSTPYGELSTSQTIDANWAGEQAALDAWCLQLLGPLPDTEPADQGTILALLNILRPEAANIFDTPSLRPTEAIADACCHVVLVRSTLQEARIEAPARDIVRRVNLQRLHAVGLQETRESIAVATNLVGSMTPDQRSRAAGFYHVRDHAALWLFSNRSTYFDDNDNT